MCENCRLAEGIWVADGLVQEWQKVEALDLEGFVAIRAQATKLLEEFMVIENNLGCSRATQRATQMQ